MRVGRSDTTETASSFILKSLHTTRNKDTAGHAAWIRGQPALRGQWTGRVALGEKVRLVQVS